MELGSGEISEFELINAISAILGQADSPLCGIGDDCAVIPLKYLGTDCATSLLVTCDTMVDKKHFRRDWTSAEDLGKKLAAVNVSDVAAMGGAPRVGVISVTLPPEIERTWVEDLYRGLAEAKTQYQFQILGGDTVSGEELSMTLTLLGTTENPIYRSGAQVGDEVWVSGFIGAGYLGRRALESGKSETLAQCVRRYHAPEAKAVLGKILSQQHLATAMIDVSDGLLQDVAHLARQSRVSIELIEAAIPIPNELPFLSESRAALFSGGDDYELVFTAGPRMHEKLLEQSCVCIGAVRGTTAENAREQVLVTTERATLFATEYCARAGIHSLGYDHFGRKHEGA